MRLDLGYDGTDFSGWAVQPRRRTVQGVVEEALQRVLRLTAPPRLQVAGRTDAGVHARAQVCHVDLPPRAMEAMPCDELARRLRGVLPPDIAVHQVSEAPAGFHARFAASWRRYCYRLVDRPEAVDPLRRFEIVQSRPLDLDRLTRASALLLGEHDFAAFCRRREGASSVRTLLDLDWARGPGPQGLVTATVRADAFCHSMVRSLVGALLPVGEGRRPVSWPHEVLRAAVRDPQVTVAPARGLTLEEVAYPPAEGMRARVEEARRYRG